MGFSVMMDECTGYVNYNHGRVDVLLEFVGISVRLLTDWTTLKGKTFSSNCTWRAMYI